MKEIVKTMIEQAGYDVIHRDLKPSTQRLEENRIESGLGDSAWLLYGLTRSMKPEVCVEIGSAQGKSACFIGAALRENGKGRLFAIDPHTETSWNDRESVDTLPILRKNLIEAGVDSQVEILRNTSSEAAKNWDHKIDLLFIDGDHSYDGVMRDWNLFIPHLNSFGTVIFHDTLWEYNTRSPHYRQDMGVPEFVEKLRQDGYPVITLSQDFGVSMVQQIQGGIPLHDPSGPLEGVSLPS
ncbi:MAG: class I SAM-dependent methyltransferase [Verrucomicrobiota bacterium]